MAPPTPRLRVNHMIRISPVRVIGPAGETLGVLPIVEARRRAEEAGLDLVEVAPMARPPVCKIADYGKMRFEEQQKEREARRNQKGTTWKEVQFEPDCATRDIEIKVTRAMRFLEEGNHVRLVVRFRRGAQRHPELGRSLLQKVVVTIGALGTVTQQPLHEGNNMSMVVAPVKKAAQPRPQAAPAAPAAKVA